MIVRLERAHYEMLIKQLVYMEEYLNDIASRAAQERIFRTEKRAKWFFEGYIREVESLFRDVQILENGASKSDININGMPLITLGSSFTLIDRKKRVWFCHMTYDLLSEHKDTETNIYFLSPAGRTLLMKKEGEAVRTDIGKGICEFTVNTINIS